MPWDTGSVLPARGVAQLQQPTLPCHFPGGSCAFCRVTSKLSNSLVIVMCPSAPFDLLVQ